MLNSPFLHHMILPVDSFCLPFPFICYAVHFLELQSRSLVVFCCGHSGNLCFLMFQKLQPHLKGPMLLDTYFILL